MKHLYKLLSSSLIVLITLAALLSARYYDINPVETLRLKYYDYLITSLPTQANDNILMVDIGEESLKAKGQWPWPRQELAAIVDRLTAAGAASVTMVLFFPEADRQGGDQALADAMQRNDKVLIAQTGTIAGGVDGGKQQKLATIGGDPRPYLFTYPKMLRSNDTLEAAAAAVGMAVAAPEIDGVTRRLPLIVSVGDVVYPSITMQAMGVAQGKNTIQVKVSPAGVEKIRVQGMNPMNTDANSRVWLTWNNQFEHIEAVGGDYSKASGKHVIIGLNAAGLTTMIATPQGLMQPHELQAQLLATAMDGRNISESPVGKIAELLTILLVGLALIVTVPRMQYVFPALGAVLSIGGVIYYSNYQFGNGVLTDAAYPSIALFLVFVHLVYNKFIREAAQRRLISKQFSSYLSPDMVKKLQKNPDLLKLGGDTRELSIMFTDVRGFTSISEHYGADVQGLTKIMNRYMTAMTAKIIENKGTLDKYIGDAQMAFWNAPLDNANHAKDAVKTALEMLGSLDAFNKEISTEGVPPFGMGLGINTGSVVVGNMGSDQRFDYTCLGDSVNLASRLEGQSKPYHVAMVIGDMTNEYVKDDYITLPLDCIAVKGKKYGVNIHTVLQVYDAGSATEYLIAKTEHIYMMADYNAQRFKEAAVKCRYLLGSFDGQMDGYYEMWIERCAEMEKNPPGQGWDRVHRTNSK
jgi:adenylate cyclase